MLDIPLIILYVNLHNAVRVDPQPFGHRRALEDHCFARIVIITPVVCKQRDACDQKTHNQTPRRYEPELHGATSTVDLNTKCCIAQFHPPRCVDAPKECHTMQRNYVTPVMRGDGVEPKGIAESERS
jgi:hypothetical protein